MPGTCAPCAPQSDIDLAGAASCAGVTFPITLNDRWRVVDDPLQWIILECRAPSESVAERNSAPGWGRYRPDSYCATRTGLQRCIRRKCGDLHPGTLARIDLLPDLHQDW